MGTRVDCLGIIVKIIIDYKICIIYQSRIVYTRRRFITKGEGMKTILWNIILFLRRTVLGEAIADALIESKLCKKYNDREYKKDQKCPTEEMKSAQVFFARNENRVKNMCDRLSDEKSREIFMKAVEYRQTHDISKRPEYSRKDQYFPKDIVMLTDSEVFVDCGAYNGDSIRAFLRYSNRKFQKIIAFEGDDKNCRSIRKMVKEEIVIKNCVVWNEDTYISFEGGKGSSSKINENAGECVKACKIDSVSDCQHATFVKMDIEGGEYNALLGAYSTIVRKRPKLAICIYHSDEDMLRIFELINSWKLDYKFYVRHHAQKVAETVLYAMP
ncbi:MAG: FkbM family methyltransferase [Lachnospiraceae bacterium]|nr:FkbM family methyltransferase [Lachnospiraceae bacterium]